MARLSRYSQPVTCIMGRHLEPPPRNPAGPIVATCPCCGRVFYSHGYSLEVNGQYSHILMANFPAIVMRAAIDTDSGEETALALE